MELCDQEAKKFLGKPQYVKSKLLSDTDELKIKQKAGVLNIRINQDKYHLDVKITVPDDYHSAAVKIELKDSNFPENLVRVFIGQAVDMARTCVEAPLRRRPKDPPFEPKPSLRLVCDFLVDQCARPCPQQRCPICQKRALPEEPKEAVTEPTDHQYVERVYCSHLFHYGCLDKYMKTPPFQGGKKCPACKQVIYHDRWKVTSKLAEERWAHHEAKKRELSEVVDFLGDCL